MIDFIKYIDTQIFFALNGDYAPWLDKPMWYASKTWPWLPVYAFLLWCIFKKYSGKSFLFAVLSIAAILFFCDRGSVELFKEIVQRLRPSRDPFLADMVHSVKDENGNAYIGGMYGFFSSHAANYAGIATFFITIMRPMRTLWIVLLVVWVLLISYSRIYLGVHYPFDVLAGWCFGIIIGIAAARWFFSLHKHFAT